jgi:hypothetical protein
MRLAFQLFNSQARDAAGFSLGAGAADQTQWRSGDFRARMISTTMAKTEDG